MAKEFGKQSTPADRGGPVGFDTPQGCLLRLIWMASGNAALLALVLLSLLDLAYRGVVEG